ncbi:MAG: DUF1579 family protein [Phycisphaeraceae bacterium]|nr:DUF1579 family protein [Phycisphaeraceae bacterium]
MMTSPCAPRPRCPISSGTIAAIAIASAAAFGLGIYAGQANHKGAPNHLIPAQDQMDPEAMMQAYEQLSKPDEHHKSLEVFVGTWDVEFKAMMPGMEDFNSKGTATFAMLMGGRFLKQDFHGDMMGSKFHGIGLTGYHKTLQRFEGVWFDDSNTAMSYFTGKKNNDGWIYEGEETDPMAGTTLKVQDAIAMQGNDKFTFTRSYPAAAAAEMGIPVEDGKQWVPSFQITYKRQMPAGNAPANR